MEIITATVTGTDPGSRGAEIGSRFGEGIRDAVDGYLEFFGIRGLPEDRVRGIAESCFATLEAWAPNLAAELAATAEAAGVPLWRLAALNARTEVLAVIPPDTEGECSTAVFAPPGDAAPETIQTWDWHAHLCRTGLVFSYAPDAPHGRERAVGRVTMFTELGVLGKIGVNDAGIGVHFNILHHESDRGVGGAPGHATARRVLDEATSVDEAEAIIASAPASASTVLTVVARADRPHRAACFEISPERVSVVRPDADGWLIHTNNFVAESQLPGEATRDESTTYARLAHLAEQRAGMPRLPIEQRAAAMCGEPGALAPICFRPDPAEPLHEQWTTLLTVGLDTDAGALEYFPGSPVELAEQGARRA